MRRSRRENSELHLPFKSWRSHECLNRILRDLMKLEHEPKVTEGLDSSEGFRVKIVLAEDHFPHSIGDQERLAWDAEFLYERSPNKTEGFEFHTEYLISSDRGLRRLIFRSQFVEISQPN